MRFSQVNFQPQAPAKETAVCPKCESPVTRHVFRDTPTERLSTYHCPEHGDVVPVVKVSE